MSSEFTLTLSPKSDSDLDMPGVVSMLNQLRSIEKYEVCKHSEGHINYHIYVKTSTPQRTNNLGRHFKKFVSGESDPAIAVKVTNAHTYQNFINYVYHEVPTFLDSTVSNEEHATAVVNKVVFIKRNTIKSVTKANGTHLILQICRRLGLSEVTPNDQALIAAALLDDGYTLVQSQRNLTLHFLEVNYLLTQDIKYVNDLLLYPFNAQLLGMSDEKK